MILPSLTIGSALVVALATALPANAAPRPMSTRSTPELSRTAQLQLADT